MKLLKQITATFTLTALLVAPLAVLAADAKTEKAKPYPLKTCVVSDEKLGGGDMTPYTFTHEGQEVTLCCKSCLKDFKKDTAKYMKKIANAKK